MPRVASIIDVSDLSQIVAIDVETTGLSPNRDRIVEVALVGLDKSANPDWSWQSLINPGRQIPAQATAIHGITSREVAAAPAFSDLSDEILQSLQGKILMAHNLQFDAQFLRAEIRRSGRKMPALHGVDTLDLARRYGWRGRILAPARRPVPPIRDPNLQFAPGARRCDGNVSAAAGHDGEFGGVRPPASVIYGYAALLHFMARTQMFANRLNISEF